MESACDPAIESDAELEAQFQVYLAGQNAAMSGNASTSSPKQATTAASSVQPTPINAQAHSPPLHSVTDGGRPSSPEEDKVLLAQQQTLAEAADAAGVKTNHLPALTNNDHNDAELEAEFQVYLAGQKAYTTNSPKRATAQEVEAAVVSQMAAEEVQVAKRPDSPMESAPDSPMQSARRNLGWSAPTAYKAANQTKVDPNEASSPLSPQAEARRKLGWPCKAAANETASP